jgi:hypothetical protein
VQIAFPATCTRPTPCATNPSGTFNYTAVCIGQDEFAPFVAAIEQVCGAGSVTVSGFDGGVQGYAHFQSGQVCRTTQGSLTVTASISGVCVQGCSLIGTQLTNQGFTGSCAVVGTTCNCTATRPITVSDMAAPYTTTATTLTITTTGSTYETCLTGNVLTTRQLGDGGTSVMGRELGVATLTKP